ncbi:recombination protein NinG [Lonsdalea quercina]|uniref:recombination protein NinG n=1 Tax=Lonsdalea quercina TaxID=71657 RepID=UPI0039763DB3
MAEQKKRPRRRCKVCREWFHPRFPNEQWCSPEHGAKYGLMLREKERLKSEQRRKKEAQQERRATKIRKLEVQPLSYFHKKAQQAFNQFIRERDASQPCISCGRFHDGQWHAGHYRTVGASPETRYDETNCHRQCAPCNNHLSGNIENYTPNLIVKIGQDAFDLLMGPHKPKKWTREELQDLAAHYRNKTRGLIKHREES